MRALLAPIAGVAVVVIVVVAFLVATASRSLDNRAEADSRHLAHVAIRQIVDDLRGGTLDYTWWDESVRRIVLSLDKAWATQIWGYYQQNFRGNDIVMALAPDGSVIMVWRDGKATFGGKPVRFEPDLDGMIKRALASPVTNPQPVIAWMKLDGAVYLVSVAAITPSDPNWARQMGERRGVGIFARKLQPLINYPIAKDFLLTDLHIAEPGSEKGGLHMNLDGPHGKAIAELVWTPELPGRELALTVLLPIALGLLLAVPLIAAFMARARRMVDERARLGEHLARERELGALKNRFISMVSHEFRTPLAVIMASSEMLNMYGERLTPEQRAVEANAIEKEVERLTRLIDEVMALGRTEADDFELKPEKVDLGALCREIANRALLSSPQRHEITVHGAQGWDEVCVDAKLVDHILANLIGNAIKYSPGGEPIDIGLNRNGDMVTIEVTDRGIGIPAEDVPELGTPFFRAGNVGQVGGTGLGLAIVQRAAQRHGGSLRIDSEVGRGTRVAVTLRLAPTNEG